ncbi:hypothetical protein UK23_32740 [Lentzea aerocolonigenes]|uniref:SH3b domain-containing protein n=1 Tax=Lentzea aerocolonigenes TaxID=68170 RepID=A0A0F0GQ57_LENAE|nr:hypothetical protein UK23_32740 [Lentzea aerocolonigenes]
MFNSFRKLIDMNNAVRKYSTRTVIVVATAALLAGVPGVSQASTQTGPLVHVFEGCYASKPENATVYPTVANMTVRSGPRFSASSCGTLYGYQATKAYCVTGGQGGPWAVVKSHNYPYQWGYVPAANLLFSNPVRNC